MSKTFAIALVASLVAANGLAQAPSSAAVNNEVDQTLRRVKSGKKVTQTRAGLDPCKILQSGLLSEVFDVDAPNITYRAGSTRHAICLTSWPKPDAKQIKSQMQQQIMDYLKRKQAAQAKRETFNEKMPIIHTDASVSLTIMDDAVSSKAQASAKLEGIVATLKEGKTVQVRGRSYTTQVDYEPWLEGVGDRAAWAPKLSQLSVAAAGVVFHVTVKVTEPEANQAKAIALARKVAAAL